MTARKTEEFLSPVVRDLPPSGIRRFFDLVANTKGVISLGVGEPDFVTPWHVRDACISALEQGYTMYTSNYGLPELRREISLYLERRFGVQYDPATELLVTVGASEAVDLALRAVVSPGDEVLIPEPCYVSYKPCAVLAGGRAVTVPTRAANDFRLTAEDLRKALSPRSKVLILSYPSNPTGASMSRQDLAAVAQVAEEADLLVISDEIYAELTYHGRPVSFASLPGMRQRTILVSGLSKAFAMTGWRVGYLAAQAELVAGMVKIHQYGILCAPVMGQKAAVEALKNGQPEMERMVNQYNQRRRLVVSRLREMGLPCFEPHGAFYAFPEVASLGMIDDEFAERLLEEEQVAVVPGNVFGAGGQGHIRISYATALPLLTEALNRLERFVERHRQAGGLAERVAK